MNVTFENLSQQQQSELFAAVKQAIFATEQHFRALHQVEARIAQVLSRGEEAFDAQAPIEIDDLAAKLDNTGLEYEQIVALINSLFKEVA